MFFNLKMNHAVLSLLFFAVRVFTAGNSRELGNDSPIVDWNRLIYVLPLDQFVLKTSEWAKYKFYCKKYHLFRFDIYPWNGIKQFLERIQLFLCVNSYIIMSIFSQAFFSSDRSWEVAFLCRMLRSQDRNGRTRRWSAGSSLQNALIIHLFFEEAVVCSSCVIAGLLMWEWVLPA